VAHHNDKNIGLNVPQFNKNTGFGCWSGMEDHYELPNAGNDQTAIESAKGGALSNK